MKLPFTLIIDNKPNFFVEKIWKGLLAFGLASNLDFHHYQKLYKKFVGYEWCSDSFVPKIHTIRREQRWRAEMTIELTTELPNNDFFNFAPEVTCLSVQEICISHTAAFQVSIDGRILNQHALNALAINDGFKDINDFKNYFDSDFNGQIVHWTSFRYESVQNSLNNIQISF